jgi:AcrR family transcriptional regulator
MPYSSNQKRKKILTEGKALFWKYGFKRITVEEICSAAHVSKMTYYKFFANKMELIKTILEEITKESLSGYREIMDADIPFTEKITRQIEMKMNGTSEMSSEFMNDLLLHAESDIHEIFAKTREDTMKMVYSDYLKAQQEGDIRPDIKPEFIIYFLNHLFEMLQDEKLSQLYESPNEMAMELVKFFFYGIVDRDKKVK